MGGSSGDWTVVRSRKRKATEPVPRGQAATGSLDGHGRTTAGGVQARQSVFERLADDRIHDQPGGGIGPTRVNLLCLKDVRQPRNGMGNNLSL
jgi:hypothetical protein